MAAVTCSAEESDVSAPVTEEDKPFLLNYPNLENSDGEVVLTNEHVVLQRLVVGPGEWEGVHSHPGNQIFVHIKGGEWSGRLGGEIEYSDTMSPDGEVGWMDACLTAANLCWRQGFLRPEVGIVAKSMGEEIDSSLQQANSVTIRAKPGHTY